ncbi:MAG TPA: SIMPL domain-containing protein, partial [Candidatus Baltobacteraceae bacterium]|nr:SIMPL domain-containing protein [Candidatus Baltobacteraceae bacterium]
ERIFISLHFYPAEKHEVSEGVACLPSKYGGMRLVWATIFLAALPVAGAAQAMPSGAGPPMRAQAPMGASPRSAGITVSATGTARVAATSARITLQLGSARNEPIYNAQTVAPIVDAMVKAGVDRNSVQLPLNFSAPGNANFAAISGVVPHPTLEMMREAVPAVGAAIVGVSGAVLQSTQVSLHADSCSAAQQSARRSAIVQAHSKAVEIAQEIGAKLGSVISLTSNDQYGAESSCTSAYTISPYGQSMIGTPNDYLSIPITSFITITYAIK